MERDKSGFWTLLEIYATLFGFNPEILEIDEEFAVYPEIVATTPLSGKD